MKRVGCGLLRSGDKDRKVRLCGWVDSRRDHGGLIFIDLRDMTGKVQILFRMEDGKLHGFGGGLRLEYVIEVEGLVKLRAKEMVNDQIGTGEVEIEVCEGKLLNRSDLLPFLLDSGQRISEELRLKYRYLDLRRGVLRDNLVKRHGILKVVRRYLDDWGGIEVETPILNRSTPEGARDFVVPSRIQRGKFYALMQSPQIFKQLLMVGGFEKYYQIVKCFRDEDTRADRQLEFTQIDIEMAFAREEEVMGLVEGLMRGIVSECYGRELEGSFEVLDYKEAKRMYGTDKPDLRFDLRMRGVGEELGGGDLKIFRQIMESGGNLVGMKVESGGKFSRKEIEDLKGYVSDCGLEGLAWMKVRGGKLESNISKYFNGGIQHSLMEKLRAREGDLLLFLGGDEELILEVGGKLRVELARRHSLISGNELKFVWVTNFPLFKYNREEGRYESYHHPFTSSDLEWEEFERVMGEEPLGLVARSYDLVLNGVELGGGSIRIHDFRVQEAVLKFLGGMEGVKDFEFLLDGLRYGAPPHGGIALGLDRIVMLLQNQGSIRDVIAFPKTQKGVCLLSGSPSVLSVEQLEELGLGLDLGDGLGR